MPISNDLLNRLATLVLPLGADYLKKFPVPKYGVAGAQAEILKDALSEIISDRALEFSYRVYGSDAPIASFFKGLHKPTGGDYNWGRNEDADIVSLYEGGVWILDGQTLTSWWGNEIWRQDCYNISVVFQVSVPSF